MTRARPGFDPTAPATRAVHFARLVAEGRRLFLKEKFEGNGRTCGTCHVESNNFTIDPKFIATLPASDPLFVAETNPALAALEKPDLMRKFGLILVNVDGFGRAAEQVHAARCTNRTGTGVTPRAGPTQLRRRLHQHGRAQRRSAGTPRLGQRRCAIRDFAGVAIGTARPETLNRIRGVDFRVPTDEELDALAAYQLPLGRQEDFDLSSLELKSALSEQRKDAVSGHGVIWRTRSQELQRLPLQRRRAQPLFALNPATPGFSPRLDGNPHDCNMAAPTNVNETPLALALALPRDGGFGLIPLPTLGFGNLADIPGVPPFPSRSSTRRPSWNRRTRRRSSTTTR